MSDLEDIVWLGAAFLALRAWDEWSKGAPNIQQKGADLYDQVHDDQGHKQDLPGKQWSKAQLVDLAARAGFVDPKVAAAIALAESGGVPNALGDLRDGKFLSVGLWQINTRAHPKYVRAKLTSPEYNADAAWELSEGGRDWSHWSTWWADPVARTGPGQGSYRRYL